MTTPTEGVGAPTPTEEESTRRYLQGELGNVKPSTFDGKVKVKFTGDGESKHLNLTAEQFEAIKKIIVPEPESPVSYAPCITGTVDIEGRKSEFMLLLDRPDVTYYQWSADNIILGSRVDLLQGLADAAREWAMDNLDDDIKEDTDD